jgi:hypothetical protein
MKQQSHQSLQEQDVSWKPMLLAIPQPNVAAEVDHQANGTTKITVALRQPRWLRPPISWIIRPTLSRSFSLDTIGTRVWSLCNGERTVENIIDLFSAQYALTFHEARIAVTEYIKLLVQRGVLAIGQPASVDMN